MKTLIISLLFLPLAMAEDEGPWVTEIVSDDDYYNYEEYEDKQDPEIEIQDDKKFLYAVICIKNKVPGIPSGTYFYQISTYFRPNNWLFVNIAFNQIVRHTYRLPQGSQKMPPFGVFYIRNLKTSTRINSQTLNLQWTKTNSPNKCPLKKQGTRFLPHGYKFSKFGNGDYRMLWGPTVLD